MTRKTYLFAAVVNLIPATGGVLLGLAWGANLDTLTAGCGAAGFLLVLVNTYAVVGLGHGVGTRDAA